jgi:hypothetical protein
VDLISPYYEMCDVKKIFHLKKLDFSTNLEVEKSCVVSKNYAINYTLI